MKYNALLHNTPFIKFKNQAVDQVFKTLYLTRLRVA